MTKEQKMYKGLILADLRIVNTFTNSTIKQEKLQSAYHMQQAIEKTIKLKASIKGLNLWGHNIRVLIQNCDNAGLSIGIPKLIRKNANMYTSWEANCRYEPSSIINKNSIWAAYRVTLEWLNSGDTLK